MTPLTLDNLKSLQEAWQLKNQILQSAMKELVAIPFTKKLVLSSSNWGKITHLMSMSTPDQKLAQVQEIVYQAFDSLDLSVPITAEQEKLYGQLLVNRCFKLAQQSLINEESGLEESSRKIDNLAKQYDTQRATLQEKKALEDLSPILALECEPGFCPDTLEQLLQKDLYVHGQEKVFNYKKIFINLNERRFQAITQAVKQEASLRYELLTKPAGSFERVHLFKTCVKKIENRLKNLSHQESYFLYIQVGSKALWVRFIWQIVNLHFKINLEQLDQEIKNINHTARVPDFTAWLDKVFDKLVTPLINKNLNRAIEYLQHFYNLPFPFFADPNRTSQTLYAIFPFVLAEFLEQKYQGGTVEILAPISVIPVWLVQINRLTGHLPGPVRELFNKNSLEQNSAQGAQESNFCLQLKKLSNQMLEKLLGEHSTILQEHFDHLLHLNFQAQASVGDIQFGREALLKLKIEGYTTPFGSLIECVKRNNYYDLILYSKGSVGHYHGADASGKRCALAFKRLSFEDIQLKGFLERFLEWGYSYELNLNLHDENDFFNFIEGALGTSETLNGAYIDTTPGFRLKRDFVFELAGLSSQDIKQVILGHCTRALRSICHDHMQSMLLPQLSVQGDWVTHLKKIIAYLSHQNYIKELPLSVWQALTSLESRLNQPILSPSELFQIDFAQYRQSIAQSLYEHPFLMRMALGADAEMICDLLMRRLNIHPNDVYKNVSSNSSYWYQYRKIILEALYACALILIIYSALSLAGISTLTLSSFVYTLAVYLGSYINWKKHLPSPFKNSIGKIIRVYQRPWQWFYLKSRDLLAYSAWKIIEDSNLDKVKETLFFIEKYKSVFRSFLENKSMLRLDEPLKLSQKKVTIDFNYDHQKLSQQLHKNFDDDYLKLPHEDEATAYISDFRSFSSSLDALKSCLHQEWIDNSKIKNLMKAIGNDVPLPKLHSSYDQQTCFWQIPADQALEVQRTIDAIMTSDRFEQVLQDQGAHAWNFIATLSLLQHYLFKIQTYKELGDIDELPFNSLHLSTKTLVHFSASFQPSSDAINRLVFNPTSSPLQYQRFKSLACGLLNHPDSLSWALLSKQLFGNSLKKSPSNLPSQQDLKTLFDKEDFIEDEVTLIPQKNNLIQKIFSAKADNDPPKNAEKTHELKLDSVKNTLIQFRQLLIQNPYLAKLLKIKTQKLFKKYKKNEGVDHEVLYFFLFCQSFNSHKKVSKLLDLDPAWIFFMRYHGLCQNLNVKPFHSDPKDIVVLLLGSTNQSSVEADLELHLEQRSHNTSLFEKKCQKIQAILQDGLKGLGISFPNDGNNHLGLQDKKNGVKLLDLTLQAITKQYEQLQFCSFATQTDSMIVAQSLKDLESTHGLSQLQDTNQFRLNASHSISSIFSFLTAHPLYLTKSEKTRDHFIQALTASSFDLAFSSSLLITEHLKCSWNALWEHSPHCLFYKKWLLLLGLLLQSQAVIHGKKLDLELHEKSLAMKHEFKDLPLQMRLEVLQLRLWLCCHPHSLFDSSLGWNIDHLFWDFIQQRLLLSNANEQDLKQDHFKEIVEARVKLCSFNVEDDKPQQCYSYIKLDPLLKNLFHEAFNSLAWKNFQKNLLESADLGAIQNHLNHVISSLTSLKFADSWSLEQTSSLSLHNSWIASSKKLMSSSGWSYDRASYTLLEPHQDQTYVLNKVLKSRVFKDLKLDAAPWSPFEQGWQTNHLALNSKIQFKLQIHSTGFDLILQYQDKALSLHNKELDESFLQLLPPQFRQQTHGHTFVSSDLVVCLFQSNEWAYFEKTIHPLTKEQSWKGLYSSVDKIYFYLENLPSSLRILNHLSDKEWTVCVSIEDFTLIDLMQPISIDKILRLSHFELGLEFHMEQGKLFEDSKFKGYWIELNIDLLNYSLPWRSYVALKNNQGSLLFLTKSSATLSSAILERALPQIPLLSLCSYLFSNKLHFSSATSQLYVYTPGPHATFNSDSFEALIELFTLYCLQGRYAQAEEILTRIEQGHSLGLTIQNINLNLIYLAAQRLEPQMMWLRLRLLASFSKQQIVEHKLNAEEELGLGYLFLTLSTGYDYVKLLKTHSKIDINQLISPRDEILIIRSIDLVVDHLINLMTPHIISLLDQSKSEIVSVWNELKSKLFNKLKDKAGSLPSEWSFFNLHLLSPDFGFDNTILNQVHLKSNQALSHLIKYYLRAVLHTFIIPSALNERIRTLHDWSQIQSKKKTQSWLKRLIAKTDEIDHLTVTLSNQLLKMPFFSLAPPDHSSLFAIGCQLLYESRKIDLELNNYLAEAVDHLKSVMRLQINQVISGPQLSLEKRAELLTRSLNLDYLNKEFFSFYEVIRGGSDHERQELKKQLMSKLGGWDSRSCFLITFLLDLMNVDKIPQVTDFKEAMKELVEQKDAISPVLKELLEALKVQKQSKSSVYIKGLFEGIITPIGNSKINALLHSALPDQSYFRQLIYYIPPKVMGYGLKAIQVVRRANKSYSYRSTVTPLTYKVAQDFFNAQPLSYEIIQQAHQLDRYVDLHLDALLVKVGRRDLPAQKPVDLQFLKASACLTRSKLYQKELENLYKGVEQVQQRWFSESHYTMSVSEGSWTIALTISHLYWQLKHALEHSEKVLKNLIPEQERRIYGANWIERLIFAYAQDGLNEFCFYLRAEDVQTLKAHLTLRLLALSRFAKIEQLLEVLKEIFLSNGQLEKDLQKKILTLLSERRKWQLTNCSHVLAPIFLVFEAQNNLFLTAPQIQRMHEAFCLLKENKESKGVLIEAIMGSGKTFFGLPSTIQLLRKGYLIWQIFTPQLIESSGQVVAQKIYKTYGLHMQRLIIQRCQLQESYWIELLHTLRASLQAQEPVISTPADCQSLLLCWLSGLHDSFEGRKTYTDTSLKAMAEALRLIKSKAAALIDEAHEIYRPDKETRFPLGARVNLSPELVEQMSEFFNILSQLSGHEISFVQELKDGSAFGIHEKNLEKYQTCIAQEIIKREKLTENDLKFLLDLSVPANNKLKSLPSFSKLCLFRGILTTYLPSALKGALMVNYGPDPHDPLAPAMPYQSAGMPSYGSVIKSPLEALVKTFIMHQSLGLDEKIAQDELQDLAYECLLNIDSAEHECRRSIIKRFKDSAQTLKLFQKAIDEKESKELCRLAADLKYDAELIACFISRRVIPKLYIWKQSIGCNAQLLSSLFAKQVADTATASVEGIYPQGLSLQRDFTANAEAVMTLLAKTRQVEIFSSNDPHQILEKILHQLRTHYGSGTHPVHPHVLIDGGALLRGIAHQEIASKIGYCMRDRVDYVFYYEGNNLKAWDIAGNKSLDAESIYVEPSRRFTIYDQSHSFGTDIIQTPRAHALVLLGPNFNLQELQQQAFRMRNLKEGAGYQGVQSLEHGQTISFILSANAGHLFSKKADTIKIEQLITKALENNITLAHELHVGAYIHKIKAVVPSLCIEHLLQEKTLAKQKELMHQYKKAFCDQQEIDPITFFSQITHSFKHQEAINQIIEKQRQLSDELQLNSTVVEQAFRAIQEQYTTDSLPEYIQLLKLSEGIEQTNVATTLSLAIEELEQQQKKLQKIHINSIGFEPQPWTFKTTVHQKMVDGNLIKKEVAQGPKLYYLYQLFQAQESLYQWSDLFDKRIVMTNNLIPIEKVGVEGPASLGSPLVRSCQAFVVYISKDKIEKVIALASSEIPAWDQAIKSSVLAPDNSYQAILYDLHTGIILSCHQNSKFSCLIDQEDLAKLLVQVRVASGYIENIDQTMKNGLNKWCKDLFAETKQNASSDDQHVLKQQKMHKIEQLIMTIAKAPGSKALSHFAMARYLKQLQLDYLAAASQMPA